LYIEFLLDKYINITHCWKPIEKVVVESQANKN
jgi:hypothetical protein